MAEMIKEVNNEELANVIAELKELKVVKKQVEARIEELEDEVKKYMNSIGETYIACGQYTCKLSEVTRSTFDKDLISRLAPKAYEKALGVKPYIKLTVK